MKKIGIAIIIGLLLGILSFLVFQSQFKTTSIPPTELSEKSQELSKANDDRENTTEIVISNPQTLTIPKLNVSAEIEHVGLDSEKRMDVPKDYQNVAWYELGYEPGKIGSAVIAGHFDTPQGTPGVFYDLRTLKKGDEIIIEGNTNSLTYIVESSTSYPFDEVPLNEVFDSTDKRRLNLITCEGVFDNEAQNYSDRFVVYAVLKE